MSIVRITVDDKQLALLIAFCKTNTMGCEVESLSSEGTTIPEDFRTPCLSLKGFCGPEMMTSRGKMKPIEALDFILAYAKRNDLIKKNSISLDEQLQNLFATQETSIFQSELPKRLINLFD
jgi:hypothetical protein